MPALEKWAGFNTLNDPQLEEMLCAAWRLVREMKAEANPRWLVLLGTSGAGKTLLAKRVWRWFWEIGRHYSAMNPKNQQAVNLVMRGQFCSWRMFGEEMLSGDYSRTIDLCEDHFVVLDDIACKRDKSGIGIDKLDTILDARLKRWTIITANLSIEEIANQLDGRIASRLMRNSEIVDVNVHDYNARD